MSELTLTQLEKYILAENKAEALKEITPYTANYYFLELMNEFSKPSKMEADRDKLVEAFLKNTHVTAEKAQLVNFKNMLAKIEGSKNQPSELKKWLEKFNQDFLYLSFEYPNYTRGNIASGLSSKDNISVKSRFSEEDLKTMALETVLEKIYKSKKVEDLNDLNPKFYNKLDLSRFSLKSDCALIEAVLRETPELLEISNIVDLLKEHKQLYTNKSFIVDYIWNKLDMKTKSKLLEIDEFKFNPNWLIYYILEKFEVDSLEDPARPIPDRLAGWKDLLDFFQQLPDKYFKYRSLMLLKILNLSSQIENFDEELFLKYLKQPLNIEIGLYKNDFKINQRGSVREKWTDIIGFSQNVNEDKLLSEYLKNLLPKTSKFNLYLEFFEEKMLRKTACRSKLLNGEPASEVDTIFSPSELQELHSSKTLDLLKNPRQFEPGQKVTLKLQLKNIPKLQVRVFEVNTLNYLIEKGRDDFDAIDVTGLIPSEEYSHSYSQTPLILHDEEFEFMSISEKDKGVFIVDFIGGELNSRAVIYKGSLTLVNDSQTGRNCLIVDKAGKICTGKETGFYIGNTFFASDPATGIISVPLNIASLSQKVIALHQGFAALTSLTITDPQPALSLNLIYNGESFIAGNQIELLVQVKLMMNGQPVSVGRLSNAKVVATTSNSDGLQNQNNFSDLKLRDNEDVVVNFMFPPKVQTILVEFSGEIKIGIESQTLKTSQTLSIEDTRDAVIERFYFRKNDKEELLLEVLGRNGEPIPGIPVQLKVESKFKRSANNFELISDSQGQIFIGRLEHLKQVTASGAFGSIFYADSQKQCSTYPPSIQKIEEELIELPLYNLEDKVSLIQLSSSGYIKNNLTAANTKIKERTLQILNLKLGSYNLAIGEQNIMLNIIKGEYYHLKGQNIKTKNSIIPLPKNYQLLLSHTGQNKENQLSVEVEGDSENLRAHLLTYNFVPQERFLLERDILQYTNKGSLALKDPFIIEEKLNIYKSGKRLNDEIIYVYDRQGKPSFMGNTLEKPGMLIKRNKIGQTSETAPQLNQGHGYGEVQEDYGGGGMMSGKMKEKAKSRPLASVITPGSQIRTLPFLLNPGKVYPNLKVSNNHIELPKEVTANYSYSMLVLTDGNMSSLFELSSKTKEIPKANCRLLESKKSGYIIQYERRLSGIQQGQTVNIKNIKNTEICVIDDIRGLFETLQLLIGGEGQTLKEWEFLKNWLNLDPMEKLKKYDKYASHELNLFLFHKDKEFFEGVVKPFIANKKEKQFIDWYLLRDDEKLRSFCNFGSLKILNKLELVLLAQVSERINQQFSVSILKFLKSASSLRKIDENRKKIIFDTLLSSRGEKVEIEKVERKPQQAFRGANVFSNVREPAPPMMERAERKLEASRSAPRRKKCGGEMKESNVCEEMDLEGDEFIQEAIVFTPSQGTIEYNERQYWNMQLDNEVQLFWSELAEHLVTKGSSKNFLPQSFIYDARNFSYALAMLTFIDLSFDKIKFDSKMEGPDLAITAPNNLLLLSKEIIEKEGERLDINVLCAQRFFDPKDRFVYDDEDPTLRVDKRVDEFVINKVYGSRIVVTNCTSSDLGLNITHEVPQGAVPIGSLDFLKVNNQVLSSLQSQVFEFSFYFPAAGNFSIYPATVTKGSRIIAIAQIEPLILVKTQKTLKNLETINDILSMGNISDIIDFIKSKNILNDKIFQFSNIYWLLKNKDFYENCIAVLREKGLYEDTVWSFALFHGDLETWKEYLKPKIQEGAFNFAKFINNGIIKLDKFEIREYYPLINQRAHSIGSEKVNIFNNSFKATYLNFLNYLLEKSEPSSEDWLLLANYLMAQDRFEEAIAVFRRAGPEAEASFHTKIQRDYLSAYIDFVSGYPKFETAKRICEEYLAYPVLSWRNLFIEMANQLAEFEESGLIESALENQEGKAKNADKALKVPTFNAELEGSRVKVVSQNVGSLRVDYFKIDIEVLFSLNPFSLEQGKSYSHVKSFESHALALQSGEDYFVYYHQLPDNLSKENLFIQIALNEKGVSKSQFLSYVPFNLNYNLNQDFGIIKLVDPRTKKPVPKIYVKCFVKYKNGTTGFYKDGYTDLRGSFDYVSLNKDEVDDVDKFSLIVAGGQFGFKTLEVQPPKKIGRVEGEAKQLVSKNWLNLQQQNVERPQISKYARLIK